MKRFNNAITKLYNAFHEGTLNSNDCSMCAVGNICDGNGKWSILLKEHGSGVLHTWYNGTDIGMSAIKESGYSPLEIVTIEKVFLEGTNFKYNSSNCTNDAGYTPFKETKEEQFNGLCKVVEYLCSLEGINNVMDYTKLFEHTKGVPTYSL